ncbi:hypothetical protein ASF49_01060 [Methylobacterium sp. Leaf104]|uniref:PIN domain-containing protein n=1 Tax=Methylobacterium TaxID=407 RepID=UPI0006FAA8EF|nr:MULTISPECIES: PIN domain-containing protein [Methylobacterium]KQP42476.1 hypothetical protein ASF49_01060 [Methylobacterium sp. Leaf104]MCI9878991.1 hypothetical protein [Methylobacterium goesingense]
MKQIYAIDTNLLLLLVVGTASENFIRLHKRTNSYTADDFRLLVRILAYSDHVVVTPNVLTETSNLMRQFGHKGLDAVIEVFRHLVDGTVETFISSREAIAEPAFHKLGLTDAALLALQSEEIVLLTDDLDLYIASVSAGRRAINFSHERESWLHV